LFILIETVLKYRSPVEYCKYDSVVDSLCVPVDQVVGIELTNVGRDRAVEINSFIYGGHAAASSLILEYPALVKLLIEMNMVGDASTVIVDRRTSFTPIMLSLE